MNQLLLLLTIILLTFSSCRKHNLKTKGCTGKMNIVTENYNTDSVRFYIPNAFTPDGDGLNDYFDIRGIGINQYDLKISKGKKVIFTDSNKGWGAANKNSTVKPGIYNYEFIVTTIHNETVEIKGEISLLGDPGSKEYNSIIHCSECLFGDMIDNTVGFVYASQNEICE